MHLMLMILKQYPRFSQFFNDCWKWVFALCHETFSCVLTCVYLLIIINNNYENWINLQVRKRMRNFQTVYKTNNTQQNYMFCLMYFATFFHCFPFSCFNRNANISRNPYIMSFPVLLFFPSHWVWQIGPNPKLKMCFNNPPNLCKNNNIIKVTPLICHHENQNDD